MKVGGFFFIPFELQMYVLGLGNKIKALTRVGSPEDEYKPVAGRKTEVK